MPKTTRYTYGRLKRALISFGFTSKRYGQNVVFTHTSGRPQILLPAYKSEQTVRPIHLLMIRKQLTDTGMIKPSPLAIQARVRSVSKNKPNAKPTVKVES